MPAKVTNSLPFFLSEFKEHSAKISVSLTKSCSSCRCGDDANGVQPTDESKCDYPCMGDSTLGMCGSICPENAPIIANIYTRVTPSQVQAYRDPTNVQSSVAAADTSCTSTDVSSVGEPWQPQRITPEGPAPGIPTSFVGPASGDPAATVNPTLGTPAPQSPQESPCTTESNSGLNTPSQGPQDPQGPQGPLTPADNAPEPKTFSNPNQQVPNATPSANCASPQPESYSGEILQALLVEILVVWIQRLTVILLEGQMNLLSCPPRTLSGRGQARSPRAILRFPLTFRLRIPLLGPFLLSLVEDSSCWQQQLSGKILRNIVFELMSWRSSIMSNISVDCVCEIFGS